jgi:predicted Zn-dependent protease
MLRLQNPRMRVALVIALLAIIGVAAYQIAMNVWMSRRYQSALKALERFDYDEAARHLQSYLARNPTDTTALVLAGQTARRRNALDDAIKQLRLAEQHGAPRDAVAMERRLLAVQAGDATEADALVQFCMERPDGAEATLILEALIEGSLKNFNVPLATWGVDTWLKHRPGAYEQAHGLLWRGRLSEFADDFAGARAHYQQAIALTPDHLPAQLRLTEALIRDDPRAAIPHVEKMREHHADNADVRFQTARLRRALGRPDEAAPILDVLLVETPDRVPLLLERGRVALDLQRPADAERWFQRALALAPEQREVNLALADCLRQAGRPDDAERYQAKAQEIEARLQIRLQELTQKGAKSEKK